MLPSSSVSKSIPDVGVAALLTKLSEGNKDDHHGHKASSDSRSVGGLKSIWDEFRLKGRIGLVTGGNGGLGLEIALVLAELGAKVWVLDLADKPSEEFKACARHAQQLHRQQHGQSIESSSFREEADDRLIYRKVDVTDSVALTELLQEIVSTDRRLDVCVAAAGILPPDKSCIEVTSQEFERVMSVNSTGVFNTATQAAGVMSNLGLPGSIILIASMSGSITNKDHAWIAYNTSKSAVLQMGRSMACELGPRRIRVNTLSPGHIRTAMTARFLDANPNLESKWSSLNPLGRIGSPHEIRGVVAWLASDASSFCTGSDIIVSGGHHSW